MRGTLITLMVGFALGGMAFGQAGAPHFAVVSIKPDPPGYTRPRSLSGRPGSPGPVYPGGKFRSPDAALFGLIKFAYPNLTIPGRTVVGLPEWAYDLTGWYNIEADPAPGTQPTIRDVRLMMRSLLKDRFGLRFHIEQRVMPVYFLELTDGGTRNIQPSRPGEQYVWPRLNVISGFNGGEAHLLSMKVLAGILATPLRRPVIDRTGMAGSYDIDVERGKVPINLNRMSASERQQRIIQLVRQKLGLKLVPGKAPAPVMVVDAVHRPTPNQ